MSKNTPITDPKKSLRLVAVKALIRNGKGKILVLRQSHEASVSNAGKYHVPGGIVDPNEMLEDSLMREIQEETGLNAKVERLACARQWSANLRGEQFDFVGLFYECKTNSPTKLVLDNESVGWKWVGLNDLESLDIVEPSRSVVREALLPS